MYSRELVSYTISFVLVTLIGVYGINLPRLITGEQGLVDQYYYLNWKFFIPFDYFLIMFYLLAALFISKIIGVKSRIQYLLVILGTTLVISGGFMLYFTNSPPNSSFFSQWFHSAGFKAVMYDIVLLTLIYIVYVFIMKSLK